jgi:hypothetical protein
MWRIRQALKTGKVKESSPMITENARSHVDDPFIDNTRSQKGPIERGATFEKHLVESFLAKPFGNGAKVNPPSGRCW